MYYIQDQYIHELTANTISWLLKTSAWKVPTQSITSEITNDNDLSEPNTEWMSMGENTAGTNAFSDIRFGSNVKRILDVGGGRFDCNHHYMKQKKIDLLVWDPYNRKSDHNKKIKAAIDVEKVAAVTSMSVLNVIPETSVRLAHINTVKAALIIGGKAYFKIWPGEFPFKGSYLSSATESSYQSNTYANRFLREIEVVFGIGNVELDRNVPNLIVAVKKTHAHTSLSDIITIQKKSEKELIILNIIRKRSLSNIYSSTNIFKLFSTNLSFFNKLEKEFLQENRYNDPRLQHEYDKRNGLVLYKR